MGFRSLCTTSLGAFTRFPVAKHSIPLAIALGLFTCVPSWAQTGINPVFGRQVGGVRIDADGVMRTLSQEDSTEALELTRENLIGAEGQLAQPTHQRLISLKAIRDLIDRSNATGEAIPEEAALLGGLTRVESVFAYPERNDIVLAGPAEPWTAGPNGTVVGVNSGKPIIHLDDLLGAFRTVEAARTTGVSVSIEPTAEGTRRLNRLTSQISGGQVNWQSLEAAMRNAFGPQQIKLEGVAPSSHMARVILAADYKMKLYGMNLAEAPVRGLPSYLEMVRSSASTRSLQSRWWMACDYQAIEHSKDKLAWKLTGRGIKTMTEEEHIASDGTYKSKGKADPIAQKWADIFTSKLDELAVHEPVFGELRNIMDLCVVAAIIQGNGLQDLAQCDLTSIIGETSTVKLQELEFPTSLDPQCSFVQAAQGLLVSASGGVLVDSWLAASKAVVSNKITVAEAGSEWSDETRVWQ